MRRVSVAKILFQGKSKSKLVLTGIGMLISMLIISSVFQIYSDFGSLLNENKKEGAFEYIQISKEIGVSTALGLSSSKFSKKEVDRIKSQLFVEDVGELWSNDFRVYGKFAGNAFDMFFTSIEHDFIDADLDDFTWREGQQEIPDYFQSVSHYSKPCRFTKSRPTTNSKGGNKTSFSGFNIV